MTDQPKTPMAAPGAEDTKASYFDRLDAAFARLTAGGAAPSGSGEPQSGPSARAPGPSPAGAVPSPGMIAAAFTVLLALEDGEPGARPLRLTSADEPRPPAAPQITDAFIDEVVRRVVQRLGADAVRAVVTDVVSEAAERLVKEEIARIRTPHA